MDNIPSDPRALVLLCYFLAALLAVVGGVEWLKFEMRRDRRAKADLPFHASDMSTAITATAFAMILAGSGFILDGFV
jgi:hypothetical protein